MKRHERFSFENGTITDFQGKYTKSPKTCQEKVSRYTERPIGYVPFSKEGAELLFQVIGERNERKPVIITTNKGFGDWTQIFGDSSLTAALLDRV
ncbi:MAG: ATP-binding protein, partial [Desulfobacteria bacterium]